MRRSVPQLSLIVLVLGLLLIRETQAPPLAGVEEAFINWLAANSAGAAGTLAPVTLIEIDDSSLEKSPWPWSPVDYVLFLDGALQFQAAAVAVAPVLAWDDKALTPGQLLRQPQYLQSLHDRILKTPKLLLGAELGFPEDPDVIPPLQPMPVLRKVRGPTTAVPEYTTVESEPGEDLRLSAFLGFTNIPNPEVQVRRAPLLFRYRGQMVPSFVLRSLMLWYGLTEDDLDIHLGATIQLGDKVTIPIDDTGAMMVDWKAAYTRADFDDFLLAVEEIGMAGKHTRVIDPGALQGKLLVLARTDAKARNLWFPTGHSGTAGELFAAAIATAETKAFVRPGGWIAHAVLLILALLLSAALSVRRKHLAVPLAGLFVAGYLLASLVLFEGTRVVMPMVPMLGLTLFVTLFRLAAPPVPAGVRQPAA